MENKQQDRALDMPAASHRDKHIIYLAERDSENENNEDEDPEKIRQKKDADSGNDSTNEILQKEKLIDPGNEHTDRSKGGKLRSPKYDADAGGDGTGTFGSKPE